MADGSVVIDIDINDSDAEKKLKSLKDDMQDIDKQKFSGLKSFADKISSAGKKAGELGNKMKKVSAVAGIAEAAIFGVAKKAGAAADDINTLSAQTGISTDELQKFSYASDLIDVALGDISRGLAKTTKAIKGDSKYFKELGISVKDAGGNLRSTEDVFFDTIDALGKIEDETQRDIYAQELFGKSFQNLNPLIEQGTGKLRELYAEAESGGIILSQEELDKANAFNDTLDKLKGTFTGVMNKIGAEIAPVFNDLFEGLREKVASVGTAISDFIGDHPGFTKLAVSLLGVTAALAPLLIGFDKFSGYLSDSLKHIAELPAKLSSLSGTFTTLSGALGLSAGSLALILGAVVLLAGAFVTLWESSETFRESISTTIDGIKLKFDEFCQGIVDRLNELGFNFKDITDVIVTIWNGFCEVLGPVFEGAFAFIANTLSAACDIIIGILDIFIGLFTGDWEQFGDGIGELFSGVWEGISGFFGNILNVIKGVSNVFLGWFGTSWSDILGDIKTFFKNAWTDIKNFATETVPDIIESIVDWFGDLPGKIWDWLVKAVGKVSDWGDDLLEKGVSAAKDLVSGFIDNISSLPGKLMQWGADAVNGFIQGIKSRISGVVESVKGIASTIASYLHFSEPDIGPLAHASTFMPDMMSLYAKGIKDNIPKLREMALKAADALSLPELSTKAEMSAVSGFPQNSTTYNNGITISFNGGINWSGSNDIEETMDMIQDVISRRGYRLG